MSTADLVNLSSTMGVPFEALLPYAIMLGVRRPAADVVASLTVTDVRLHWSDAVQGPTHAERWKASETFHRSMGQSECGAALIPAVVPG